MCSIFSVIDFENSINLNKFNYLNSLQSHRGPDYTKTIKVDNVFLGSNRLKIYDTTDLANQPFFDETKDLSSYSMVQFTILKN